MGKTGGALMPDREEYRRSIAWALLNLTKYSSVESTMGQTLMVLTSAAVSLIRGADCADVILIDGEQYRSVAPTSTLISELDAVQMQYKRGPCLEATTEADAIVRASDLATDQRWPEYTAAALTAGVRSVLSFQLYNHRQHGLVGALNIVGTAAGAFTVEDEAIGALLATHAANVLKESHSESARIYPDRDVLGQAKGILMERLQIDAAHAVAMMVTQAQDSGAPIHAVARDVIAAVNNVALHSPEELRPEDVEFAVDTPPSASRRTD
jgi:hypothetical protein